MADQDSEQSKKSSGCFGRMAEMMQSMMSKKGSPCCPFSEKMAEMMPECCSVQKQQETPAGEQDREAPK